MQIITIMARSFKEGSRLDLNPPGGDKPSYTHEDIITGSIQRIADATEKMAQNYIQMQNDRDLYLRWYREKSDANAMLNRRICALRGVITKLKKRK